MKNLVILGAGGHGKVVADIAEKMGCFSNILFLDDHHQGDLGAYDVIGCFSDYSKYIKDSCFVVAIGSSVLRKKLQSEMSQAGARFATLIHPAAVLAADVAIGDGSVVMAGAVVNPGARIGNGVILNTCSSVDHDCVIGDFAHVSVGAHLAGTVVVGEETMIGAGAVVINNITIVERCMIGAGATVVTDLSESGTYIGTPARRKHENTDSCQS